MKIVFFFSISSYVVVVVVVFQEIIPCEHLTCSNGEKKNNRENRSNSQLSRIRVMCINFFSSVIHFKYSIYYLGKMCIISYEYLHNDP